MKHFRDMLKFAKNGIMNSEGVGLSAQTLGEIFSAAAAKNEVFVFAPINQTQLHIEVDPADSYEELLSIDAPFEVFSIEIAGEKFITTSNDPGFSTTIKCMMFVESSEACSDSLVFIYGGVSYFNPNTFTQVNKEMIYAQRLSSLHDDTHANASIAVLVRAYLDRINREADGLETVAEVIYLPGKKKGKKIPHVIRRIFHICPKKLKDRYEVPGNKRIVEWTHQWSVRGTWVRLGDGRIGKNRKGDYCVSGRTWRVAHTKGDTDAPLVKKVRVVADAPEPD